MARLPQVGGDDGNWGSLLNEFLLEAHTNGGALKPGSVGASEVSDGSLPSSKLSASVRASLAKADAAISTSTANSLFIKTVNGTPADETGDVAVDSGPQGPQGAQGAQGAAGNTGPQGAQGLKGDTGNAGPQGAQGVTGAQGAEGGNGAQGAQGAQGPQGAAGAVGAQGFQGSTGTPGSQGVQGAQGATGVGAQGSQGAQGATGANGPTGSQGAQGFQGAAGPQGADGGNGAQGAQGAQGAAGATGAQGFQGSTGTPGSQGAQGAQGVAGSTGSQGSQGPQGFQGFQGSQGAQGFQGATPITSGTSSTSTSIAASGSKSITTTAGMALVVGDRVRVAATASPATQWMEGIVTAYTSGTGALTFTADNSAGSGTIASWNVSAKVGSRGAQGAQGFQGFQGTAGTNGNGVPTAGATGQQLVKNSATNYDTAWANPAFASVTVSTGSEARPTATFVMWVGGSTQPTNMAVGDVWMKA